MSVSLSQLKAEVILEGADDTEKGLRAVGDEIDRQGNRSTKAADQTKAHDQALSKLGTGAMAAGGLLLAGFGLAVGGAADFEKKMSGVGAVADANARQMGDLRQAALDAGAATAFSASDAADAEAELAKAGVSVADILGGALRGSLDLAAAGQISVADAATISAQALNIFNLAGSQTGHVADLLAAGANKSAADVGQLGQALQQGGLLAKQTGLSLEDTVGVLSLFADNALMGSDAGTSLKTMLQRLTPQSAEAKAQMEELGISAYDAQGQFIGLDKFAQNLRTSMADLTPEARNAAMGVIFGSDAVRAANILYEAGGKGIREYTRAVNDSGAAQRMASEQLDNLAGDFEQLKGSLDTVLIQGGSGATSMLRGLTQEATAAVNTFGSLPEPVQGAAVGLTGVAGAGLLVTGAVGTMIPRVRDGIAAFRDLKAGATGLPGPFGEVASAFTGLIGGAFAAGVALIVHGNKVAADSARRAAEDAKEVMGSLDTKHLDDIDKGLARARKSLEETRAALRPSLGAGGDVAQTWQELNPFVDNDISDLVSKKDEYVKIIKDLKAARSQLTSNTGRVRSELGDLFGEDTIPKAEATDAAIMRVADSLGVDLTAEGTAGEQAVHAVAEAMGNQTSAAYGSEASLQAMGAAADGADSELQSFKATMDSLLGVHLDAREGAIKFEESIDSLSQSVKDNGLTFDITNEKGRANAQAMIAASRAALEHAEAVGKETGSVGMANITLAGHINQLADTAHQVGMTDEATLTYLEDLYGIPAEKRTDIHTTADLASLLVQGLHRDIDNTPTHHETDMVVKIHTQRINADIGNLLGGSFGWLTGNEPHSAAGNYFPNGGLTWVGEQGRELVEVPPGARVHSNAESMRIARDAANARSATPSETHVHLTVQAPMGQSPVRWGRAMADAANQYIAVGGRFPTNDDA